MAKKKSYDAYLRQQIGDLIDQLELSQLEKRSLKERWLDQMIWADQKSSQSRRAYYRLRLTTVIGGVILPALVGISVQLGQDSRYFRVWFPPLTFALSQVIAVSVAIEEFCKFGDRWRDYRKMAEELKSEGWQYLQSSGPYEFFGTDDPSLTHQRSFAQFTNRVESIIRNDVQSYISDLMQQQARQDAQAQQLLAQAQATADNDILIEQMNPNYGNPTPRPPNSPSNSIDFAGRNPIAPTYPGAPSDVSPLSYPGTYPIPAPENGQFGQMAAPIARSIAAPPVPVMPSPTSSLPANLNAAIVAAAQAFQGTSSADGPGGGRQACAYMVDRVLQAAKIPSLGENPRYVPEVLKALEAGRGQKVAPEAAKAGDLVIAYGEEHIGIGLEDGCRTVLSNSSSNACFSWVSDLNYDNQYGGPSTVYRLLG